MSRAASPFSPRVVLAVLVIGAGAFLLLLYAIGAGWDGRSDQDGGAHAAANGLNGFAGLARLLEAQGHHVSLTRSEGRLDDAGLLVLTPQLFADGETITEIIDARRHVGPTLLILPKWQAVPASLIPSAKVPKGWVALADAEVPDWLDAVEDLDDAKAKIAPRKQWEGIGFSGTLPEPKQGLAFRSASVEGDDWATILSLVTDEQGDVLAGYLNDNANYPALDEAGGYDPLDEDDDLDGSLWPVVIVAEPDLMNNYGMADRTRAELAHAIVDAATDDDVEMPVMFDLTLAGLGRSENLLTLAFRPPFLAATLCLLLAALVIAWRSFRRFGPPVTEAPALAMGKRQLATNGAGLIERAKRIHLLGPPYAALVAARIAAALGIREADPAAREAAVARTLAARGIATDYSERIEALRHARRPAELLRAAGALRTIERTLTP